MAESIERRLAAILITDVVGYTRLMRADEEGTLNRFRAHRSELIEPKIAEFKGRIVKVMGDGLLVEFASVVEAVRCITEIQRGMATRNTAVPEDQQIILRAGINLGDVIVEGDDIHGDGVNVATRMQEIAPPGGISVSGVVYDSVRDKLAPGFEDLGPQQVKNISEPVRAYRVVLDPEASGTKPEPQATTGTAATDTVVSKGPVSKSLLAIINSVRKQGPWTVPKKLSVTAVMGSVNMDFCEARFGPGISRLKVTSVMGGVTIIVPPDLQVACDGLGILGHFESLDRDNAAQRPEAPLLRITGVSVLGSLEITTRFAGE